MFELQTIAKFAVYRYAGLWFWTQAAWCRFGLTQRCHLKPILAVVQHGDSQFGMLYLKHSWCFAHPLGKSSYTGVSLNIPSIIFFEELRIHFLNMLLLKKKDKHLMIVKG